ncbi:MAG: hypothetical protein EBX37_17540 [Alphaproteobacteria bacterium]|nr:hypothetical protein [Alphaproteobacteria bacterium]
MSYMINHQLTSTLYHTLERFEASFLTSFYHCFIFYYYTVRCTVFHGKNVLENVSKYVKMIALDSC